MIILIPEDKDYQTYIPELEIDEESAVIGMSISFAGTGDISERTTVTDMMDIDVMSSNVVGLIGSPYEIETSSNFDEATITFTIDQSKLGDTEFANLGVLWYDEENQQYKLVPSTVNEETSTLNATVTHFSEYMAVDKEDWAEAWAKEFNYTNSDEPSNTVLAIDCSGSMAGYDPISWKEYPIVIDGISSTDYKYSCYRISAGENYTNTMRAGDKAAVVGFNSSSRVLCNMTSDKENVKDSLQDLWSSGGTSFDSAITSSINLLNSSESDKKFIILMSDGEATLSNNVLQNAINKGIKIYTLGLGVTSGDTELQRIAEATGGTFNKAASADELEFMYYMIGLLKGTDLSDNDEGVGDGIPDIFETEGMRTQNGKIIHTDPNKIDTDGDGLSDGEEINSSIRFNADDDFEALLDLYNLSQLRSLCYFRMSSNPNLVNSDRDGIDDYNDASPLNKFGYVLGKDQIQYFEIVNDFNYIPKNDQIENVKKLESINLFNLAKERFSYLFENPIKMDKEVKKIHRNATLTNWSGYLANEYSKIDFCEGYIPFAAELLDHYLNNSGEKIIFDASDFINNVFGFKLNYDYNLNLLKNACENAVKENETIVIATTSFSGLYANTGMGSYNGFYGKDEALNTIYELDAFLSLNVCSAAITCECSYDGETYVAKINYYIQDYYNFYEPNIENGKNRAGLCSNDEMALLQYWHMSEAFDVLGTYREDISWKKS